MSDDVVEAAEAVAERRQIELLEADILEPEPGGELPRFGDLPFGKIDADQLGFGNV